MCILRKLNDLLFLAWHIVVVDSLLYVVEAINNLVDNTLVNIFWRGKKVVSSKKFLMKKSVEQDDGWITQSQKRDIFEDLIIWDFQNLDDAFDWIFIFSQKLDFFNTKFQDYSIFDSTLPGRVGSGSFDSDCLPNAHA